MNWNPLLAVPVPSLILTFSPTIADTGRVWKEGVYAAPSPRTRVTRVFKKLAKERLAVPRATNPATRLADY